MALPARGGGGSWEWEGRPPTAREASEWLKEEKKGETLRRAAGEGLLIICCRRGDDGKAAFRDFSGASFAGSTARSGS